jgi:putative hydrolase
MADDRGRGDETHGERDDEPGDEPGAEQGDERGHDDAAGPSDAEREPGESPFGLPLNRPGSGSPGSGRGPAGFGAGTGGFGGAGGGFGGGGGFPGLPDLGGMDPSDLGAMLERVLGEAAVEGNDVHDEAAARAVADAVAVATLWLDEQTTLASPAWRATGLSRAEWVEATMPRWFELIEPVSDGVTAATSDAMRKQVGELGPEAFGEALPEGLPEGFDPREMVEQWAPMLGNLSRQMFSAQLGQAVGTLATEVVTGTEVGLPLTEPGVVALLPGNVSQLADSLEIDVAQVRLYLAVREAARVRLFAEVPWLGPQLLSAVSDYARNITIDTEAIESALSTIDPSDPEALRSALQGNLFRPQPTPAQRAALDRLETLLALAEGWVDHVTDRTTARHLPQSAALAETIRRRRVGGAAQKTFAGLVGLELRPRRLRDAANLWAALESAGGAELRDGRWAHPDLAPTSADLDDVIGFVERATGESSTRALGEGSPADSAEGPGDGFGADLDSVLQGILEEADRERGGTSSSDTGDSGDSGDENGGGQRGPGGDAGPTR